MDMIREWIITIISVVFFITFIEMLLPNSDNRRYINVVIGLLIISIVLKPISNIITDGIYFDDSFMQVSNEIGQKTLTNRLESTGFNQRANVIALYKKELKSQMKRKIESQSNVLVRTLKLEIEEEDKENFGMINKIFLVIEEQKEIDVNDGTVTNIAEIKVSVSIAIAKENSDNIIDNESILINKKGEEIKQILSSFYKVPVDNIIITVP